MNEELIRQLFHTARNADSLEAFERVASDLLSASIADTAGAECHCGIGLCEFAENCRLHRTSAPSAACAAVAKPVAYIQDDDLEDLENGCGVIATPFRRHDSDIALFSPRPSTHIVSEHDAKGLEIIAGWLQRDGLVEPATMLRRLAATPASSGDTAGAKEPLGWFVQDGATHTLESAAEAGKTPAALAYRAVSKALTRVEQICLKYGWGYSGVMQDWLERTLEAAAPPAPSVADARDICGSCSGSGFADATGMHNCFSCNGSGASSVADAECGLTEERKQAIASSVEQRYGETIRKAVDSVADAAGASETRIDELLEQHIELNLGNYTDDDVRALNDWAIDAHNVLESIAKEPK